MHPRHLHMYVALTITALLTTTGGALGDNIDQDFDDINLGEVALVANIVSMGVGSPASGGGGVILSERGGWGDHGVAAANCQWLLTVNTIVATMIEIEQLGLVTDEDEIVVDGGLGLASHRTNDLTFVANGTATCTQEIGPIFVHLDAADGFGEPAPQASGLMDAMASIAAARAAQLGELGSIDQDIDSIDKFAIVGVLNVATLEVEGVGNAGSNCQLAIAWNTVVLNDISITQAGTVDDDDSLLVDVGEEARPIGIAQEDPTTDVTKSATAESHCRQTIDSITLTMDEDTPTIPPQS